MSEPKRRKNPDSFRLDDMKQTLTKEYKQQKLLEILKTYKPEENFEILYLFYSARTNEFGELQPVIFDDIDYIYHHVKCIFVK